MNGGKARQLAFDLSYRPALGREDFLVTSCNKDAVGWIDRWPDWPAPALALIGPAGCGKTHLAAVWRAMSGARATGSGDDADPAQAGGGHWLIDDAADADAGIGENALLRLYNVTAEAGATLLLVAREPPARWAVTLPDLASRLRAAPVATIRDPDETAIAAVLVKLFADRQSAIDPELIAYLLPRMERSFEAARDLVARLDRAALAKRRRVTVPIARDVLAEFGGEG